MVVHVEFFFTYEHSLDELIEVFVFMADQTLDLASLSVSNDLVFYNFAISDIREHHWEDG